MTSQLMNKDIIKEVNWYSGIKSCIYFLFMFCSFFVHPHYWATLTSYHIHFMNVVIHRRIGTELKHSTTIRFYDNCAKPQK